MSDKNAALVVGLGLGILALAASSRGRARGEGGANASQSSRPPRGVVTPGTPTRIPARQKEPEIVVDSPKLDRPDAPLRVAPPATPSRSPSPSGRGSTDAFNAAEAARRAAAADEAAHRDRAKPVARPSMEPREVVVRSIPEARREAERRRDEEVRQGAEPYTFLWERPAGGGGGGGGTAAAPAPMIPEGYDPAKARRLAPQVSNHLRNAGRANYSRPMLADFQRAAGIVADRIYGGGTRGALLYYGAKNPPKPYFSSRTTGTQTLPYVPPEQR